MTNEQPYTGGDWYDVAFENIFDGALILTDEGSILDANANLLSITGYSEKEIMHQPISKLISPVALEGAYDHIWQVNHFNQRAVFETELLLKNGKEVKIDMYVNFLDATQNGLGNRLLAIRDITAFSAFQKKNRDQEDYYRFIIDKGHDAVLRFNHKGRLIDASHPALALTGYNRGELSGMLMYDLIIEPKPGNDFKEILFNYQLKTKTGELIPIRIKACNGFNKEGLDNTVLFIYEMKEYYILVDYMEKEKKLMEKILSGITNQSDTGIIIFRPAGGILYSNELVLNTLDYTEDEIIDQNLPMICLPEDYELILTDMASLFHEGKYCIENKYRFISKNKNIFQADVSMTIQKDEKGTELVIFQINHLSSDDAKFQTNEQENIHNILAALEIADTTGILIAAIGSASYAYANNVILKKLGYNQSEIKDIRPVDLIHPEDFSMMKKPGLKLFFGLSKEVKLKSRLICKNKNIIKTDFTIRKYKDKTTKKIFWVMLLDNIQALEPATV